MEIVELKEKLLGSNLEIECINKDNLTFRTKVKVNKIEIEKNEFRQKLIINDNISIYFDKYIVSNYDGFVLYFFRNNIKTVSFILEENDSWLKKQNKQDGNDFVDCLGKDKEKLMWLYKLSSKAKIKDNFDLTCSHCSMGSTNCHEKFCGEVLRQLHICIINAE